jgi:uncharacterized protein (DUF4213/DUF364 family)
MSLAGKKTGLGFEYSPTPEYIAKLGELANMKERVNQVNAKGEVAVQQFLRRYGDFLSTAGYTAANPEDFLNKADLIIAEGEALLSGIAGKK